MNAVNQDQAFYSIHSKEIVMNIVIMKKTLITGFFIMGILISPHAARAEAFTPPILPNPNNEQFFYEIGGGSDFRISGGVEVPQELMMIRDFGLLTGDQFDPRESIKATLKGILDNLVAGFKGKIKNMLNLNQLNALFGFLPGNVICQANPTACQLNENYTIRAEERERFQRQFYEKMEAELGKARGKLDGWLRAGKANNLIKVMNSAKASGEKDLEILVGKIREYSGKDGLKWIGGIMAGGDGQPPIRPIADTAKAGFNMLLGRSPTTNSKATGDDPILDYWDTPEEAAKWLTEVVGEFRPDINNKNTQTSWGGATGGSDDGDFGQGGEDVIVTADFLRTDMSTPAMGLTPKVRKESETIAKKIKLLTQSSAAPTKEELTQLMGKSTGLVLTPKIIKILKNSPIEDVLIKQIADDAAQANVIRYALEARRILLAGRNENHIASYDVATNDIDNRAQRLKEYIDDLMYERKINNELAHNTISKLYQHTDAIRARYSSPDNYDPSDTLLEGGRRK